MFRLEMIEALLHAYGGDGCTLETYRQHLLRMKPARLKREMLLRGLIEYEEPAEEDDGDHDSAYAVHAAMSFGLPRSVFYAE